MEVKLKIDKTTPDISYKFVEIELRGEPNLVEALKNIIIEFVNKPDSNLKYY